MTQTRAALILRANAVYLMAASAAALFAGDLPGIFLAHGPVSTLVGDRPYVGIGFVEAHGLAFIFGVLLWRALPARTWFLSAMAVEALLGTCNVVFWDIFRTTGMLGAGYVLTTLHWVFACLQLYAALASSLTGAAREPMLRA